MRRCLGLFVFALVVAVPRPGAAFVAITECGVTVPSNQKAVLQNDVVCGYRCSEDRATTCGHEGDPVCGDGRGSCEEDRIIVQPGAVLALAGHEIMHTRDGTGVRCESPDGGGGRCVIKGPGSIRDGDPVIGSDGMDIVVRKLTLSGPEEAVTTGGRLCLEDVDLEGAFEFGLEGRSIKLKNVRARVESIYSHSDLELDHVELAPFTSAGAWGTVRGRDVVFDVFGELEGRDVYLRRASTTSGSGGAIGSKVWGRKRLRLVDSSLSTIASGKPPILVRSTCEESRGPGGIPWGLCPSDSQSR